MPYAASIETGTSHDQTDCKNLSCVGLLGFDESSIGNPPSAVANRGRVGVAVNTRLISKVIGARNPGVPADEPRALEGQTAGPGEPQQTPRAMLQDPVRVEGGQDAIEEAGFDVVSGPRERVLSDLSQREHGEGDDHRGRAQVAYVLLCCDLLPERRIRQQLYDRDASDT